MYTDITQQSTKYVNRDVTQKMADEEGCVLAEARNGYKGNTHSMKRVILSAVSGDNPAFDGTIFRPEDGQPHDA